jgi:hypothetical protein
MQGDDATAYFMCTSAAIDTPENVLFTVTSHDCQDRLTILLADLNSASNTVRVLATSTPAPNQAVVAAPSRAIPEFVAFTVSPYALPFSYNTLLRSGNRFGVYIRQIEPSRQPCEPPACDPSTRLMRLSLIWFPRDFIPPRERRAGIDLAARGSWQTDRRGKQTAKRKTSSTRRSTRSSARSRTLSREPSAGCADRKPASCAFRSAFCSSRGASCGSYRCSDCGSCRSGFC